MQPVIHPMLYPALKPWVQNEVKKTLSIQSTTLQRQENGDIAMEIIGIVAAKLDVPVPDMLSQSRRREVMLPRCIAISHIRRNTTLSLKKIGNIFGRDHSTVIYSLELYNDLLQFDKHFQKLVSRVNL